MIKFYRARCGDQRVLGLVFFQRLVVSFFSSRDMSCFAISLAREPWRLLGASMVTP